MKASQRTRRHGDALNTAIATQNAHPACRLGIAAYRLTSPETPCGFAAPKMFLATSVSVIPCNVSLGGATGTSQ
jgi:hypothetical protein